MRVYIACESSGIKQATEQLIGMIKDAGVDVVQDRTQAHLIVTDDARKVFNNYRADQFYAVITQIKSIEDTADLPENTRRIPMIQMLVGIIEYVTEIASNCDDRKDNLQIGVELQPIDGVNSNTRRVLIIDDTIANLKRAVELLGDDHIITLADGYDTGMSLITANQYDVVLTDCRMPLGLHHDALPVSKIDLSTTEPNGLLVVFFATLKGAYCAVVTDGGHHADWVAAAFDDLQQSTVNGQKVLFFNSIGKDWKYALDELIF